MNAILNLYIRFFCNSEEGTTTVEYALLITLILVFCISAILSTGDVQKALWFDTADTMTTVTQKTQ